MLALVAELNSRRIAMVGGRRVKRLGGLRMLSDKALVLLKTARTLHQRFMFGDYRHSDQEQGRIVELCNLLLQWHAENENASPPKPWVPTTMLTCKQACKEHAYDTILGHAGRTDDWSELKRV